MLAKIFLVCLIATAALQGAHAKHVEDIEVYSLISDSAGTVEELKRLFQEFFRSQYENLTNFAENSVRLVETTRDKLVADVKNLIDGIKQIIQNTKGIAQDIVQAGLKCLEAEEDTIKNALKTFQHKVYEAVNNAKQGELKVFEELKATNCGQALEKAYNCKLFECFNDYANAFVQCKKDISNHTFKPLLKEALEILFEAKTKVHEAISELHENAGSSLHNILDCLKENITH